MKDETSSPTKTPEQSWSLSQGVPQTQPSTSDTRTQTLPNELLLMIARFSVEPWGLTLDEWVNVPNSGERRLPLKGFPILTNVQLASKLFQEEIRAELFKKFDGSIVLHQAVVTTAHDFTELFTEPDAFALLAPQVTKLTIQNNDNFTDMDGELDLGLLPNLKELIFELKVPKNLSIVGLQARPVDIESAFFASVIMAGLISSGTSRGLVNRLQLEDRKIQIMHRMYQTKQGWISPLVVTWYLNTDVTSQFRGCSVIEYKD